MTSSILRRRFHQTYTNNITSLMYPSVRRDQTSVETIIFNGQQSQTARFELRDPYRWLEDPESPETKQFVADQNQLFQQHIVRYPHRQQFQEKLTNIYDYEKFGCPFRRGQYLYYFHNSGLQSQSVLYRIPAPIPAPAPTNSCGSHDISSNSANCVAGEPELFFDPNKLTEDGTAALSTFGFTESGSHFAYGVSYSGSDWITIKVRDAETKQDLPDCQVDWAKFTSIHWTHDGRGFFYNRYPKPSSTGNDDAGTETQQNTNAQLRYRFIGGKEGRDLLVLKDDLNPTHMFGATVSDDGRYAVVTVTESCDPVNKLYLLDLQQQQQQGLKDEPEFVKVVDNFKAEYSYITNEGPVFYFKTNLNSPRYKVVQYDLNNPGRGFVDFIPETKDVLQDVSCIARDRLVTVYLKDVKNTVSIYNLKTGALVKDLPVEIGSIDSLTGRKEDREMFYKMSSFVNPGLIYRYNFDSDKLELYRETKLNISGFSSADYETNQVFYKSKDGTKIPMFIVSKKGTPRDGNNPTLLYGYGGFNIPLTPMFSPAWIAFIRHMGGVVAVANLRGGGEYGEEWHKAGSLRQKQNVFDDFQWAAKYLVANQFTQHSLLAINGGSNGGLLVGACVNQAPELFACAMADVGVMDMLRFHKFTIGHAWKSDYGDPDKWEDFEYLIKYSPVHNVRKDAVYPHVLLLTSDHDDRVVPLHSYKFIAELQHSRPDNPNPLLIRIETKAGHGAGKPTKKKIEEATDRYSFLALAIKTKWIE